MDKRFMHTNYANVSTNFLVIQKDYEMFLEVHTISGQAFLKQFVQVVCPVLKNKEVHILLCVYQADNEYDLRNTWIVKTS